MHLPVKLFKALLLLIAISFSCLLPESYAEPYIFFKDNTYQPTQPALFPKSQTREVIPLSGPWQVQLPDGSQAELNVPSSYSYNDKTVFIKEVFLPDSLENKRFKLVCDGLNNQCRIMINDQFVHFQAVGGSRFETRISPEYLRFGQKNKISFEVDNRLHLFRTIPTKPVAYSKQNFGGIFRGVYLVSEPEIKFDDLDIHYTLKHDTLKLDLGIKLSTFLSPNSIFLNDTTTHKEVVCSFQLQLDTLIVKETPELFSFIPQREQLILKDSSLNINDIISWGPRFPARYTLTLSLKQKHDGKLLDEFQVRTGFRKLSLQKNVLNINGIPAPLKGVTVIEERQLAGNVLSKTSIQNDIKLIKGLGANAIRFKEPPNPYWIEVCDSLGLLCFIDFPNVNVPAEILSEKTYVENSDLLLRQVIQLTKYSPSVIALGLGTGFDLQSSQTEDYLKSLSDLITDHTTHLVFFSPKRMVESKAYAFADFVGLSFLDLSLSQSKELISRAQQMVPKDIPFLVTQYGSAPEPNNHNGYSDPSSLEFQSKVILDHFNLFKESQKDGARMLGSFVFALSDYHFHIPPIKAATYSDNYLGTYGLTTLQRERKMSYDMVKSLYAEERVYNPPIGKAPQDFSPTLILIATLLTAGLVFLLNENRRIRENIVRALIRPFHLFMDIRDQRVTYPQDPLILIGLVSLLWGSILAALLYSTQSSYFLEFWLSHIIRFNGLKELMNYLVLNPEISTFVFGGLFFVLSFLMCALLSLYLFIIGKAKVTFLQLMNLWSWVSVHWFFLIFIAAFIDRISSTYFTTLVLYMCLAFLVFGFYRLFHGLSIVANLPQPKVQLTGFLAIILFISGIFFIFDHYYQTTAYINYLNQTMIN